MQGAINVFVESRHVLEGRRDFERRKRVADHRWRHKSAPLFKLRGPKPPVSDVNEGKRRGGAKPTVDITSVREKGGAGEGRADRNGIARGRTAPEGDKSEGTRDRAVACPKLVTDSCR
jgi:hypothetical protein